jgi:hypothetical protein
VVSASWIKEGGGWRNVEGAVLCTWCFELCTLCFVLCAL